MKWDRNNYKGIESNNQSQQLLDILSDTSSPTSQNEISSTTPAASYQNR
jgi:hypothetical protein